MAEGSDHPNILFILADQLRHDWIEPAGSVPVRTPTVQRLAERGVFFTNAICPSPLCAPSRACLAEGVEYDLCAVPHNQVDFPLDRPTYYRRLRDETGYHVTTCGKLDLDKGSETWGRDGKHRTPAGRKCRREELADLDTNLLEALGFSDGLDNGGKWACFGQGLAEPHDPYMAYLERHGLVDTFVRDFKWRQLRGGPADGKFVPTFPTPVPEETYLDNWIARQGLELLESMPTDRPWHLVVNFAGPHEPMDVTERMHSLYRSPAIEFPTPSGGSGELDAEIHTEIRRNYSAMVENIDRWLALYLETLESRGEFEETLVVFGSDHGEMLGDHGQWTKLSPYQASVGIPLVVAGAGVEDRAPYTGPVSLIDLHDTFVELAGLAVDPSTDSRSLVPILTGASKPHRDVAYSGLGSWRMVTNGTEKLVLGYDPDQSPRAHLAEYKDDHRIRMERPPLLFDLETDERTNLIEERPSTAADLRDRLADGPAAI